MSYDFSQLNDKEFEILVIDLLGLVFEKSIERFKPGRDAGVDGRYFSSKDQEIVLQCKHYLRTGYRGLITKLYNEEKSKLKKINPAKYIFVTSLPLSRDNKKEIKSIFNPYIKRDDDIFGQEDLNGFLSHYPRIEEKHFKLWISSTTVLNRIINNAIKGRSEYEIEQIQKRSYKYVKTESLDQSLDILKLNHVLIITGEPGVGKTTLAENICLYFSSKDYEFIDIEESISEAESIYTRGKKQIFYFDDFLGSNYFEAITNKKDSHIVKFIERIRNDNTKLFVLTSRTNILNSGVLYSAIFSNKNIRKDEYLLMIESLTQMDKAKILYNHIWFSGLSEEYIDEIYKNRRYIKIINHQNYNPRLIEFITDINRIGETDSDSYWGYIEERLNNPKDIWSNCFKIQNNAYVCNLVALTVFNGGNIDELDLQKSFDRLNKIDSINNTSHTEKDFSSTSQLATKSFLQRYRRNEEVSYSLFNPSISDYILGEYCRDANRCSLIFRSLQTVQSLKQLISLERDGVIDARFIIQFKNSIFEEILICDRSYDYQIIISDMVSEDESKKQGIVKIIQRVIDRPGPIRELIKFLSLLDKYIKDLSIDSYGFMYSLICDHYLDETEIRCLAEFMDVHNVDDDSVLSELGISFRQHIEDELESQKANLDLTDHVEVYYYEYGERGFISDTDAIQNELFDIVQSIIKEFDFEIIDKLEVDIESIVDNIDIDEMVNEYIDSQVENDDEYQFTQAKDMEQDIDDLFERA